MLLKLGQIWHNLLFPQTELKNKKAPLKSLILGTTTLM